jgi:hypothetical protein
MPSPTAALIQAPVAERPIALPPERLEERIMPITPYLDGHKFDAETKRVMGVAFEMTLAALRLTDWNDPSKEIVAKKIIALAQEGMRDPNLLCEWALDDLRKPPPRV